MLQAVTIVVTIVCLLAAIPANAMYWDIEMLYGGGFVSGDASLAYSPTGIPSVSFTAFNNLYVSTKTVGGWDSSIVSAVGYSGGWSSVAFSPNGQCCVAYIDTSAPDTNYLRYAYRTAGSWVIENVDDVGWLPDFVQLQFDASGKACIAYCKTSGTYPNIQVHVRFARRNGPSNWSVQSIAQIGAVAGPSLTFGSDGTAYVSFRDQASGQIRVASQTGVYPWQVRTLEGTTSSPVIGYTSIALQPSGKPAVAYYLNDGGTIKIRYAALVGSEWRIQTACVAGTGEGYHCSLIHTPGGIPIIVYREPAEGTLRSTWRIGDAWLSEELDSSPRTGFSPRLKLDGLGNVGVAYCDRRLEHVKYAIASIPRTIKEAKLLPDGADVVVSGATASVAGGEMGNTIYVQQSDRSSGIQVRFPTTPPSIGRGMVLDIRGTMTTTQGERAISDPEVVLIRTESSPRPLAMKNASVGGGDYHYSPGPPETGQKGVSGSVGLNNIGLLIQTSGRVKTTDTGVFTIEDGSGATVRCSCPGITPPSKGSYVIVTGVSSCEQSGQELVRVLRVRNSSDIVCYTQ